MRHSDWIMSEITCCVSGQAEPASGVGNSRVSVVIAPELMRRSGTLVRALSTDVVSAGYGVKTSSSSGIKTAVAAEWIVINVANNVYNVYGKKQEHIHYLRVQGYGRG